ncbi:hypothetical protein AAY55_12370 [Vibrio metoecus]|uniref:Uncharacterized protein n=1 Tax=Vibrio metoecus TaxID=1481663 RepID=A0A0Q0NAQ6_VIBMT|nr:hypothetical protein AAY55_12370 [Vibrio metoecus]
MRLEECLNKEKVIQDYELFIQGISELHMMQKVAFSAFNRELRILDEFSSSSTSNEIVRYDTLTYFDLNTGKNTPLISNETSLAKLKELTYINKNNQYCWLLATAFELFEVYINSVYCNDSQSRNKRDSLNKKLSFFSRSHERIKQLEKDNVSGINLKVAIITIEKLRHCIVHNQGVVIDTAQFISKVIEHSGVNNNRCDHVEFISQFIVSKGISVAERAMESNNSLPVYSEPFKHLLSYLVGYAKALKLELC